MPVQEYRISFLPNPVGKSLCLLHKLRWRLPLPPSPPPTVFIQEAKYVESWPNTTSVWASWSRFDIPVDRYGGVHSLLWWPSRTLGSATCH